MILNFLLIYIQFLLHRILLCSRASDQVFFPVSFIHIFHFFRHCAKYLISSVLPLFLHISSIMSVHVFLGPTTFSFSLTWLDLPQYYIWIYFPDVLVPAQRFVFKLYHHRFLIDHVPYFNIFRSIKCFPPDLYDIYLI